MTDGRSFVPVGDVGGVLLTLVPAYRVEVGSGRRSRRFRWAAERCKDLLLVRCCLPKLGTLCVLLGTAGPAVADPAPAPPLSLAWRAPQPCPGPTEVEREITAALAQLRARGAVDMAGEVAPREGQAGFWLRVKVTHAGQVSERVLALDDCRDAARASALLVALSVENLPPPTVPKKAREPQPPPAEPLRFSVGLGPRLALGIAPALNAGVGLSVAYSRSFWRLSARGAAFAESHHTLAGSQLGGSFQLVTAGAFACAGSPSRLGIYGCLGGRFDHLGGNGTGTSRNASASTSIGSVAAGVTLEWTLTRRFSLRSELEAGYALGEARFVITNQAQPVHEVHGLRGEAGLELAVAF